MIPIRPKPKEDEILSSWLIRCAIANGSDPEGWGGGIWNEYRIWTRDFDRSLPKTKAAPLCRAVGMTCSEIASMTLEPLILRITNTESLNPNTAWPWVIPTGIRNRSKFNGLNFCPECLKEAGPYSKKQWRLSWNTACAKHRIILHLRCPQCHTVFSPHLVNYLETDIGKCQKCGFDLRQMDSEKADSGAIHLQEILNLSALTGDANSAIYPDHSVRDMFATLRMIMFLFHGISRCQAVQRAVSELTGSDEFPVITYVGNALETADVTERHYLMMLCSEIFCMHIDDITELFHKSGITRQMIDAAKHEDSPVISFLLETLPENGRDRERAHVGKKKIEPRSKEQVEKLMDEIRRYL